MNGFGYTLGKHRDDYDNHGEKECVRVGVFGGGGGLRGMGLKERYR